MEFKYKEKQIEKILVEEVKKLGGRAYKWESPGNNGVPDRIVIFPGRQPVFVELKTDTGTVSSIQNVQIKRLMELGQEVKVLYGLSGIIRFFEDAGYVEIALKIAKKYRL